ncbi:trypsin-like serine protease (plasmid) [Streptomyces sp. NBC_00513]|uniref:trypsin-like serine protease n=1 Tax=unclassified Streptomyces TaxID=2593676 RepID=UPI00225BFD36|nr:trypsin-like serine protease [Streptomyces sp. NBC_00424]MCX5079168.1 trypsin-like serine protease [Streptomyces sp. NBC_00424]WUD39029.1 trypsin-like serine protease [Streptomyces sp. NBC_00513]WUD45700.1 trypsin-like serine protease [Streptomyces sp. NBC_00513]WUD46355.1 trypsin-like serine protease [Streptomyces sp. NBC_00513]
MSHTRSRPTRFAALAVAGVSASLLLAGTAAALVGGSVAAGEHSYTARLTIGPEDTARSCTATLIDQSWVVTAASCFAATPGDTVPAGKPQQSATVTFNSGQVATITDLKPRAGRDLVLGRLDKPITAITPANLATTAPTADSEVSSAGYGYTQTLWGLGVNKPNKAAFKVTAVNTATVDIVGKSANDAICKGDTGAPILNAAGDVVAVASRSWQGGCIGESETRTNAITARTDDVAGWIQQIRLATILPDVTQVMTTADLNKDGRSDIVAVTGNGNLHAAYGLPDGTFAYGRPLWNLDGSWKSVAEIIGGDFNGDGNMDIAAVWGTGTLQLYVGKTDGTLAADKKMWPGNTNWQDMLQLARFKVDNSGRDGLLAIWNTGEMYAYNTGTNGLLNEQKRQMWPDKSWKTMKLLTTGDLNTDTRDDIVAVTPGGSLMRYDQNAQGGLNSGVNIWPNNSWAVNNAKIFAGDYDGDKKVDLLSHWTTELRFYKGDGTGLFTTGIKIWPMNP